MCVSNVCVVCRMCMRRVCRMCVTVSYVCMCVYVCVSACVVYEVAHRALSLGRRDRLPLVWDAMVDAMLDPQASDLGRVDVGRVDLDADRRLLPLELGVALGIGRVVPMCVHHVNETLILRYVCT